MLIRVLGSIDVIDDDGRVRHVGGRKERATLAVLAVHANSWVSDGRLIDALWGESPPPSARRTLQKYISRLRGVLSGDGSVVLQTRPSGYRLRVDPDRLDATLFEAHLAAARADASRADHSRAEVSLRAAEALFRGAPLGEFSDVEFARAESGRLAALRLVVVEERVEAVLGQGRSAEAAADLEGLCATHPLHEGFFALQMLALYRSGRQSQALRVYQQLRRTLADELGIDPSPELRALEQAILDQSPELDTQALSMTSPAPSKPRAYLPVPRSSFVGRELETDAVCDRLASSRLVTLTGVGGSGKTRVALEVAHRVLDGYSDGAFFVDLAPVDDPALVPQIVAGALGVHLTDPSVAEIADYLATRSALLVFDNCEHLVDACAAFVDTVLARCGLVTVMATSREPLSIDGEYVYSVPSLPIETDAVRLFVERAEQARADASATDGFDRAVIGEICHRLDGLPLAIELAAARVAHLQPAEILERLGDRFRLLTGGRRRVQRQHTLQAALDWSHDLLSGEEQRFLRRLAVFRGSFSLESAADICGDDALTMIGSLVAKSLVVAEADTAAMRYRLLETVRLYADERLVAAAEAEEYRIRHRDSYLAHVESIPFGMQLWNVPDWFRAEADNLRAALEWSREQGRPDLVVRMASRMVGYWRGWARHTDLNLWAEYALRVRDELEPDTSATACLIAAAAAQLSGDFAAMERHSAEAIEAADPDSWVAAEAWAFQVMFWSFMDAERAREAAREGLRAAKRAEAPEVAERIRDLAAGIAVFAGDYDTAIAELESNLNSVAGGFVALQAVLLALSGDTGRANKINSSPPGNTTFPIHMQAVARTLIAVIDGRRDDAAQLLVTTSRTVLDHALPLADVDCLLLFAAFAIDAGEYERAARLLATARAAAAFPFRWHGSYAIYQHCLHAVRNHLDPDAARSCRAEGTATTLRDTLDQELRNIKTAHSNTRSRSTATALGAAQIARAQSDAD